MIPSKRSASFLVAGLIALPVILGIGVFCLTTSCNPQQNGTTMTPAATDTPTTADSTPWPTVTGQGVSISYPPDWSGDESNNGMSWNNFKGKYANGGLLPRDGAEISLTQQGLPSSPISDFIAGELSGSTTLATSTVSVSGETGTKVIYEDTYTPTFSEKIVVVYVIHGPTLYKLSMTYNDGTAHEAEFLSVFNQVLSTIRFAQ